MTVARAVKWAFIPIVAGIAVVVFLLFYPSDKEPIPVSLIKLMANPEEFDGKLIRTEGFLLASGDRYLGRLYLSREDAVHRVAFNSLRVVPDDLPQEYGPFYQYHQKFVMIEGRFFQNPAAYHDLGHLKRLLILNPVGLGDCYFNYSEEKCGPTIVDPLEEKQHNGAQ